MTVNRIHGDYQHLLKTYQKQINRVQRSEGAQKNQQTEKSTRSRDSLELTGISREIKVARNEIERQEGAREERVQHIKEQVSRGQYNVSGEDVAGKMLRQAHLDEEV